MPRRRRPVEDVRKMCLMSAGLIAARYRGARHDLISGSPGSNQYRILAGAGTRVVVECRLRTGDARPRGVWVAQGADADNEKVHSGEQDTSGREERADRGDGRIRGKRES